MAVCLNFCSVLLLLVCLASMMSTFWAVMLMSPPGATTSEPTCLNACPALMLTLPPMLPTVDAAAVVFWSLLSVDWSRLP